MVIIHNGGIILLILFPQKPFRPTLSYDFLRPYPDRKRKTATPKYPSGFNALPPPSLSVNVTAL